MIALNDLQKHRRPIHDGLRKQLQQIPTLVEINQDIEFPQRFEILAQLKVDLGRLQAEAHRLVIRLGDADELDAALAQVGDGADHVRGAEGNVLDARPVVEVDELFDLRFLFARGGLVDGHFDGFVGRGHDDGAEGGELGADVVVVDGPEAVEAEAFFVAGCCVSVDA